MSVITPSAALWKLASLELTQARYDIAEMSDASGHTAARLFGPPRWRLAVRSKEAMTLAEAGEWEALLLKLRGGVNHLAAWDTVRAVPQGTLRGSPTLNGSHSAGATTLVLAAAYGRNLLYNASFESYGGSLRPYGYTSYVSDPHTYVAAAGYSTASAVAIRSDAVHTNNFGVRTYPVETPWMTGVRGSWQPNTSYVVSFMARRVNGAGWAAAGMGLYWNVPPSSVEALANPVLSTTWQRYEMRVNWGASVEPSGEMYLGVQGYAGGTAINDELHIDDLHVEQTTASVSFELGATLLPGDWLQVGTGLGTSQLVKCVSTAQGDGLGNLTVTIEPPLRQTFGNGTAVAWNKPLGYYKLLGMPTWGYRPGAHKGTAFALDLLEAFQ